MIIGIASDHAGIALKAHIKIQLEQAGHTVKDLGTNSTESVDYPDYGVKMADALCAGQVEQGVLICGTGIGISIAANRFAHVRAALCHDVFTAQMAREHNNANVLVLGARAIDEQTASACVDAFFATPYEGTGRHARRVEKLGQINTIETL